MASRNLMALLLLPLLLIPGADPAAGLLGGGQDGGDDLLIRAFREIRTRDLVAAEATLRTVLREHAGSPSAPEARVLLGRVLLDLRREAEAEEHLVATLAVLKPDELFRKKALHLLSETLLRLGKIEASTRLVEDSAAEVLGDAHRNRVAGCYLAVADGAFDEAHGNDGKSRAAAARTKNLERALAFYERARVVLTGGAPEDRVTLRIVRCLVELGRHDGAIAETRRALAHIEKERDRHRKAVAELRFRLGEALLAAGRHGDARTELLALVNDATLMDEESHAGARLLLAETWRPRENPGRADLDLALAHMRRFIELHPDHAKATDVRLAIAECLRGAGDLDPAVAAYREFLDRHPKDSRAPGALFAIAEARTALLDFEGARQTFADLVARYPDDRLAPEARARIPASFSDEARQRMKEEKGGEAIRILERLLAEHPGHASCAAMTVLMGTLLRDAGRPEEAERVLRTARSRYAASEAASAADAAFLLGSLLEETLRRLPEAIGIYREIVRDMAGTAAAQLAARRIDDMQAPELAASIPRAFRTDETPVVRLTTRNVREVRVRAWRFDLRAWFERKRTVEGIDGVDVDLVKPDFDSTENVPGYESFRRDVRDVPLRLGEGPAAPLPPGSWLVSFEAGELRAVVHVLVSDIRLIVKESPRQILVFAEDERRREPAAGTRVLVVTDSDVLVEGETDAGGVFVRDFDAFQPSRRVLAWREGHVAHGFTKPRGGDGVFGQEEKIYIVTDRPLYRPGQDVRVKLWHRPVKDGAWVATGGERLPVEVVTARGTTLLAQDVVTGGNGTADFDVPLPPEAALGEYMIRVARTGRTFTRAFTVAEYRRPEYAVELSVQGSEGDRRPSTRPGEMVRVKARASFFLGGPVRGGELVWEAFAEPWVFDASRYRAFPGHDAAPPPEDAAGVDPGPPLRSGSAALDDQGEVEFSFMTDVAPEDRRWRIRAAVREAGRHWVSGSAEALVTSRDVFAVVTLDRRVIEPDSRAVAALVTVAADHSPAGAVGEIIVLRRNRGGLDVVARHAVNTGLDGRAEVAFTGPAGGDAMVVRFEGRDSRGDPVAAEAEGTLSGEAFDAVRDVRILAAREVYREGETADVLVNAPAEGLLALLTLEGDKVLEHHVLRLAGRSQIIPVRLPPRAMPNVFLSIALGHDGKLLTATDEVVVRRWLDVTVAADPDRAEPGGEIGVSVTTRDQLGAPVPAEVTLAVVDEAVLALAGDRTPDPRLVFYDLRRAHGVVTSSSLEFSSIGTAVRRDADLMALERSKAMSEELRRNVEELERARGLVRESAPEGDRRGEARDDIESLSTGAGAGGGAAGGGSYGGGAAPGRRPQDRKPAKDKDNAFDDDAKRKFGFFARGDMDGYAGVPARHAAGRQIALQAIRAELAGKNAAVIGALAGWEDEPFTAEPATRREFLETAAFLPAVVTGEDGKARVAVKLPDNVTRWRITARGLTALTHVGEGRTSVRAGRDVHVRLAAPRFVTHRDTTLVSAIVHNGTSGGLDASLELRSEDPRSAVLRGVTRLDTTVASGTPFRFDAALAGVEPGRARLSATVRTAVESDAVEETLPVLAFGDRKRTGRSVLLEDREAFDVEVPEGLIAPASSATVFVSPGMIPLLRDGVQHLALFPFGCLEQTLNRFLPAAEVRATLGGFGVEAAGPADDLARAVRRGLMAVAAFQNPDGGFGWWPGVPSHPYMTALALEGIARAAELGHEPPSGLVPKAIGGARSLLRAEKTPADAAAFLHFALAACGESDPDTLGRALRGAETLSDQGLAWLAMACGRTGRRAQADAILLRLRSRIVTGPRGASAAGDRRDGYLASRAEATAWALLAVLELDPSSPLAAELVRGLRGERTGLHFGSTKATAVAVRALCRHLARTGLDAVDGVVRVEIDGRAVGTVTLTPEALRGGSPALSIPVSELRPGTNRVTLLREGGRGAVSVAFVLDTVAAAGSVAAEGSVLTVTRTWREYRHPRAAAEPWLDGFTVVREDARPKVEPRRGLARGVSGRKYGVVLAIEAREDVEYVVVEDPLPAGCDVVETEVAGDFHRFERRDTRCAFFFTRLPKGRTEIRYTVYAVVPGEYRVLPATAFGMYDPELRGRSSDDRFEIIPEAAVQALVPPSEPTPDALYALGLRASSEGRHAEVLDHLEGLPGRYPLVDAAHDEILSRVLHAALALGRDASAVAALEALELRNPSRIALTRAEELAMGRSFVAMGDRERGRIFMSRVLAAAFAEERAVAEALKDLGRRVAAEDRLLDAWLRSPDLPEVTAGLREWAESFFLIEDERIPDREFLTGPRRMLWKEGLRGLARFLAHAPGGDAAEEAGFALIARMAEVGLHDAVAAEAERFLASHADSERRDDARVAAARAHFLAGRWEEAERSAVPVVDALWPRRTAAGVRLEPSEFRLEMIYLLGRIAHVRGDAAEAVRRYADVKDVFPDARQAWLHFTEPRLRAEPLASFPESGPVSVPLSLRNVTRLHLRIYRVDLPVLFAVKKSVARAHESDLTGITPERAFDVEPPPSRYATVDLPVAIPDLPPGGYLLVVSGSGVEGGPAPPAARTVIIRSDLRLTIQRSEEFLRAYVTDAAGRPVPGARVRFGTGDAVLPEVVTDERGIASLEAPEGAVTAIAEARGRCALARE